MARVDPGETAGGRRGRVAGMLAAVAAVSGVLLSGAAPARAADSELEVRVKAAYVLNFAAFVDWAPKALDPSETLRICVLGDDELLQALGKLSRRKVGERRLEVRSGRDLPDPGDCHILVVGRSERPRLPRLLEQLSGRSVLTVSDLPGFCEGGGMIGFVAQSGRIRLEINPRAAAEARLVLRAKLLEVGKIVP